MELDLGNKVGFTFLSCNKTRHEGKRLKMKLRGMPKVRNWVFIRVKRGKMIGYIGSNYGGYTDTSSQKKSFEKVANHSNACKNVKENDCKEGSC